jgi:hypothetical protein
MAKLKVVSNHAHNGMIMRSANFRYSADPDVTRAPAP